MIDYVNDRESADKLINKNLDKVGELLDEIAKETGETFLVLNANICNVISDFGTHLARHLRCAAMIAGHRVELANEHEAWMKSREKGRKSDKLTPDDIAEAVTVSKPQTR